MQQKDFKYSCELKLFLIYEKLEIREYYFSHFLKRKKSTLNIYFSSKWFKLWYLL